MLVDSKTMAAIADELSISSSTVSTYRQRIMDKLNVHSVAEIIKYAISNKLIDK
ncbi:LuxR C-terminal-related transcriptional regulator [bacterium]|nr:LuxR C-terminal-related transcriptional regulator [bacterium]